MQRHSRPLISVPIALLYAAFVIGMLLVMGVALASASAPGRVHARLRRRSG